MIRSRRLNLEETAISSTCVRLIARPVFTAYEWDKCIICQVSTPELLIKMRNVSKNSLIEAMETSVFFRVVHSVSDIEYKNIKNSKI
jgi:hypothetical protein